MYTQSIAQNNFTIDIDVLIKIINAKIVKKGLIQALKGITIDSYLVSNENLYIAINSSKYDNKDGSLGFSGNEDSVFGLGGVFDGHKTMKESYDKGARGFVVDCVSESINFELFPDAWIFVVKDSLDAIAKLARYYIDHLKIKVVGVTGSTGKTTTTYAVASCLKTRYQVKQFYRTRTSFLGLAIDVLTKLQPTDDYVVVEMQMDGVGQIYRFCTITPPDFAIITSVNNSHLQRIGNMDAILKTKLEIYEGLRSNGRIILNGDNNILSKWIKTNNDDRNFIYGLSDSADLYASNISVSTSSLKTTFELIYKNTRVPAQIPLAGNHAVYTGLAVSSVCLLNKFTLSEACESLESAISVVGRLQCFRGQKNCYVLDDAYNANLFSMSAAIDYLASLPVQRRIAFIGSMLELLDAAERDHRLIGKKLAQNVDMLITVGESAIYAADEAYKQGLKADSIFCTDSVEEAVSLIPMLSLDSNTGILVKGSGAMRMDRITPHLLTFPII